MEPAPQKTEGTGKDSLKKESPGNTPPPPEKTLPAGKGGLLKNLGRELSQDHQFWVNTLAVKGGASAVFAAGAIGLSYAITLPFLLGAGAIVLCAGAIGVGIYGAAAGAHIALGKIKGAWWRAKHPGKEMPPEKLKPPKSFAEWLSEKPLMQKLAQTAPIRKITEGRAWKVTKKITRSWEEKILSGLAFGGSVATLLTGAWVLATQIVLLPVIALGTAVAWAAVTGLGALASGGMGLYLWSRDKLERAKMKNAADAQEAQNGPPKKTRIAQFLMPNMIEKSALFNVDHWILQQAKDILATNKPLQKQLARSFAFAGLGAGFLTAGIVGTLAFIPVAPLAAVAVAGGSLAGTLLSRALMKDSWQKFKEDALPQIQKDIGVRYLKMQGNQLGDAWQKKKDALKEKRAVEKAAAEAEKARLAENAAREKEAKKTEEKTTDKPADGFQLPDKKAAVAFGKKAFKAAAEKLEQKARERLEKKNAGKDKDKKDPPSAPPQP